MVEQVKQADAGTELLRVAAPLTQNVRDVVTFSPPKVLADRSFTDQAADYTRATDELHDIDVEKKKPFLPEYLKHILTSGAIGAGAGLAKSVLYERGLGPTTLPLVGAFGALGAGSAGVFHLAKKLRQNKLKQQALNIIGATPEPVRTVLGRPGMREKVRDFARTGWHPFYGAEAGAFAGGLGALGVNWAAGAPKETNLSRAAIAGGLGAVAGGVLGYILREKQRKKLLGQIQDEFAPPVPPAMQAEPLQKAAMTLDIKKGDTLLGGKFKNSPIVVEDIGTDELGQPTVNGRKLLAYRIKKTMPEQKKAAMISDDNSPFPASNGPRGINRAPTGGSPARPSNAIYMRGTNTDERYSAGLMTSQLPSYFKEPKYFAAGQRLKMKLAKALECGGTSIPMRAEPQGLRAAKWTSAAPEYHVATNNPEDFVASQAKARANEKNTDPANVQPEQYIVKELATKIAAVDLKLLTQLALLQHHLDDAEVYGGTGKPEAAHLSLDDAESEVKRIAADKLPPEAQAEVTQVAREGEEEEREAGVEPEDEAAEVAKVAAAIEMETLVGDVTLRLICKQIEKSAVSAENEPQPSTAPGAPAVQLRPRAEVLILEDGEKGGVYAIDKGDYILFPGGGIADGEAPRDAAIRETLEESGLNLINIVPRSVSEVMWPKEGPMRAEGFDGEKTYFFVAKSAGKSGFSHKDREDFQVIPVDTLIKRFNELGEKKDWAYTNNHHRELILGEIKSLVSGIHKQATAPMGAGQVPGITPTPAQAFVNGLAQKQQQGAPAVQAPQPTAAAPTQPTIAAPPPAAPGAPVAPAVPGAMTPPIPMGKQADAVVLKPRRQFVTFTPDGKIVVRRGDRRRFDLPEEGEGKPAPYEPAVDVIPDSGIAEPGYHGYRYQTHVGESAGVPEGYEAMDPDAALKELYASMGLKDNRAYQSLDRARSRVILRALKQRKPVAAVEPVAP